MDDKRILSSVFQPGNVRPQKIVFLDFQKGKVLRRCLVPRYLWEHIIERKYEKRKGVEGKKK